MIKRLFFSLMTACGIAFMPQAGAQTLTIHVSGGEPVTFNTAEVDSITFTPAEWHPVAVDLGLSVLWADCNVGATSPYEAGDFFAWGEVEPKDDYQRSTYFDADYQFTATTGSYCFAGDPKYDAATLLWGDGWYTPTITEIEELLNECTWRSTRKQGVNGYQVTGPSGQSIFLPAAGNRFETALYGAGAHGYYWASSAVPEEDALEAAEALIFTGTTCDLLRGYKLNGHSIRPVKQIEK